MYKAVKFVGAGSNPTYFTLRAFLFLSEAFVKHFKSIHY